MPGLLQAVPTSCTLELVRVAASLEVLAAGSRQKAAVGAFVRGKSIGLRIGAVFICARMGTGISFIGERMRLTFRELRALLSQVMVVMPVNLEFPVWRVLACKS